MSSGRGSTLRKMRGQSTWRTTTRRLCDLSCELARKYGLDLPPGLKAWEKKQRFEKEKLEPTLAETAYTEKTGIDTGTAPG